MRHSCIAVFMAELKQPPHTHIPLPLTWVKFAQFPTTSLIPASFFNRTKFRELKEVDIYISTSLSSLNFVRLKKLAGIKEVVGNWANLTQVRGRGIWVWGGCFSSAMNTAMHECLIFHYS